ncbi:DUF2267 domain-containing protein [Streptomyces reniochalinae]|uniref:DUF2267 domain-containing protein n=1 Tax=Streptomyces reniochalinae TaxID=2250578 RepID=A0A367EEB0_9ACTN|nr:DUF2267 domain-containing protein [Streptomyces reniochalinae]RCG16414.1 DUF2267 domain-containing protein [Streptomyces reniochalinae]
MRDDEFLALVRDQGGYRDQDETRKVTEAVLGVLAARITADEAQDLADQMPTPLDRPLRGSGADAEAGGEAFGVEEFYRRVAERTSSRTEDARTHTAAVLSALPQAVSAGQVRHVVTQLPEDFAALFTPEG